MDVAGKLINVTRDILSGKLNITFQIENEAIDELNDLAKLDRLNIVAKKFRKKRSLDANAYFHVLVGKLADKLIISKTRCKNLLICRYGQQEFLEDGKEYLIKSTVPISQMLEQELIHCQAFGCEYDEDGVEWISYRVFRGSHTLDTKEMSILIEGTVQECKDFGIETLTPKELDRMLSLWQTKDSAS